MLERGYRYTFTKRDRNNKAVASYIITIIKTGRIIYDLEVYGKNCITLCKHREVLKEKQAIATYHFLREQGFDFEIQAL